MQDFNITSERDLDRAAQRLRDLERYADRRAQIIATLDLDSLTPDQVLRIFAQDDEIDEALAWGHLYNDHLANMAALGISLNAGMRLAA